jgi:hypothetical protein
MSAKPNLLDHGIGNTNVQLPGTVDHVRIAADESLSSIHELAMEMKHEDFDGADFT